MRKRGIPQRLSDPQATASVHWTDPRAALAEALDDAFTVTGEDEPEQIIKELAERGVLLVTEADIAKALERTGMVESVEVGGNRAAGRIFAALSGESESEDFYLINDEEADRR